MITSMGGEDIEIIKRKELVEAGILAAENYQMMDTRLNEFNTEYLRELMNEVVKPYWDVNDEINGLYLGKMRIDNACRGLDFIPSAYDYLMNIANKDSWLTEVLSTVHYGPKNIESRYKDIKREFRIKFRNKDKFRNRISKRIAESPNFQGLTRLVNESLKMETTD